MRHVPALLFSFLVLVVLYNPLEVRAQVSPYADFETALAYSGAGTADLAASMIDERSISNPLAGPTRQAAELLGADSNVTVPVAQACVYVAATYVALTCGNMTDGAQAAAFVFAFLYSQAIVIELLFNNGGGGLGVPYVAATNPVLTLTFLTAYFTVASAVRIDYGSSDDLEVSVQTDGDDTVVKAEGTNIDAGATAGMAVTLEPAMDMPFQTTITGTAEASNSIDNTYNTLQITADGQAPPNGSISGVKWRDDDGDGILDEGEPLVPGWTIMIDGPDGPMDTMTDGNGAYSFTGLGPGQYTLSEGTQTGWVQTFPAEGGHVVDLSTDQQVEDINFGNRQFGAIKVVKYIDVDGDGVLDETEPFADGWEMTVDSPDMDPVSMTTVESTGEALFENLPPGSNYTVEETMMEGWTNKDDDFIREEIVVNPGETTEVFFGNFRYGEIIVTKFEDTNGNGVQDQGEEPIEGWEITLEGEGGSMVATGADGTATFEMLKPGAKTITEEDREGWAPSSGDLSTGIELIHGETEEISIGNYRPGKITVTKYHDLNGDGTRDGGEPGLEGWEITVDGESKETDGSGVVMFDGLEPGEYDVTETLPSNWKVSQGPNPQTVVIESGDEEEVVFGNYMPGKITVFKIRDENGDGISDPGDSPVSGWDMTCNGPSCANVTRQTGTDGSTMFTDLDPGDYVISEGTRAGWIQTFPAGNHNITVTSGDDPHVVSFLNEPPEGEPDPGSIHAQKFLDSDGDGVFDPGEVGLNGVTIRLNGGAQTQVTHDVDLNSDGTIDPHTERGWVWFVDLQPNNYTLDEVIPGGMNITTPAGNLINIVLAEGEVNDQSKFGNIPLGDGLDFGDAPEDEETPPDPGFPDGYPTRLASNGAAHVIDSEVYLGEYIDAEGDGLPSLPANGDDDDASFDDEDGVEFGENFAMRSFTLPGDTEETSVPGQVRGTTARIIFFPSVDGQIDAWVDWNRDGDWDDEGEQMYDNEPITAESDTLDWVVPALANDGFTYARFRFTLNGAASYSGIEYIGEVEDYLMYTQSEGLDIERREDAELPTGYSLDQNYPNPFNPVTTFTFAVPESQHVTIDVFDLLGKHVARVVTSQVPAGEYSVQFDASALPSGTYVYRMTAGAFTETKQFTLLK